MGSGVRISVDQRRALGLFPSEGHNRWHPDIPPISRVQQGELTTIELRDGSDCDVTPETTAAEILDYNRFRVHPLTGPIFVQGAEPGDLLDVEIVEIETTAFGFTFVHPNLGLLKERFTEPYLVKWHIEDGIARSSDLPGVAIHGAPFLGVVGVSPSHERLAAITERERLLAERGGTVRLPDPREAIPGDGLPAKHGLRTIPPREIGGNLDLKHLRAGSVVTLPVDVPGALFSAGDSHFAQGDGETCGIAIEVAATAKLKFTVRKVGVVQWRPRCPSYTFSPQTERQRGHFFGTTGISVDASGRNEFMDLTIAAQGAVEDMIGYLTIVRGYSEHQAYVIVSVACDLEVSCAVDVPNALVSCVLPLDIFETT